MPQGHVQGFSDTTEYILKQGLIQFFDGLHLDKFVKTQKSDFLRTCWCLVFGDLTIWYIIIYFKQNTKY